MESHFSVDIYQAVMDVDSNFSFLKSDLLSPYELSNRGDYCTRVIPTSWEYGYAEKLASFD